MKNGLKYIPLMTVSEFASCVGVSEGVVTGWVKRDYIPTVKMGRHRLVNVALLNSSLNAGGLVLESDKNIAPLVGSKEHANGADKVSEEQMELFMKLPRNEKRILKKKHGSLIAAAASVG